MTSCSALDFRESHWVTKCAAAAEKHPKASLNPPKAKDEAQDLYLGRFLEVLRTNDYRFEKNKESSFFAAGGTDLEKSRCKSMAAHGLPK